MVRSYRLSDIKRRTLSISILVLFVATPVWAQSVLVGPNVQGRSPSAIVLGRDTGADVIRKLGTPCIVQSPEKKSAFYLYRRDGGYLTLGVNESPSDVQYQLVESIAMTVDPVVDAICYTRIGQATLGTLGDMGAEKGARLGDSIDEVLRLYGPPAEQVTTSGSELRLRYDTGYEADRYYEWQLAFRDGRLVEWTSAVFPFFIEVGS